MALDPFPTINRIAGFSDTGVKKARRETSAAGYTMSAGAGTVMKRKFKMSALATSAEKADVLSFFDSHQGGSFSIQSQDTEDTTVYEVVFLQDEIPFDWNDEKRRWATDIEFQEV